MPDVTLIGMTTPFRPNSGVARFDTDVVPELLVGRDVGRLSLILPGPSGLAQISSDAVGLVLTFLGPMSVNGAVQVHGSSAFDFQAPTNPTADSIRVPIVVGDRTPPSLASALALSTTSVLVTFSEAVVAAEATNPANYSINNGLLVLGVVQVSATQYLLITSTTTPSTIYTVTVSNIHDLNGNLVA